ncbi:MAG TPA: hypothetical protein VFL91_25015 [Thermomicrobiales bacterium]|nr:hypothetical protein [Thermomicrobiales bacterium]
MARRDDRDAMAGRTRISVQETTPARRGGPRRLAALAAAAALGSVLVAGAALGHGRALVAPEAHPAGVAALAAGARGHTI